MRLHVDLELDDMNHEAILSINGGEKTYFKHISRTPLFEVWQLIKDLLQEERAREAKLRSYEELVQKLAELEHRRFCEACAYDHITPELQSIWHEMDVVEKQLAILDNTPAEA